MSTTPLTSTTVARADGTVVAVPMSPMPTQTLVSPLTTLFANRALLDELCIDAVNYAASNGIIMFSQTSLIHAPMTLLPSPIPRHCYDQCVSLASDFNVLYDNVSRDYDFLSSSLTNVSASDEFLASLLSILHTVTKEGVRQKWSLAINRSDYMMHHDTDNDNDSETMKPLQVEYNTIAASFSSLSTRLAALHRYLTARYLKDDLLSSLPVNRAYYNIAKSLAFAHDHYRVSHNTTVTSNGDRPLSILFVVQANESNAVDQKILEYELFEYYQISVLRRTLSQIHAGAKLGTDGELMIDNATISVCYFRAGYTPRDFSTGDEWLALLLLERSLAIKCPNIATHLAGTKKIQQVLCEPGVLERFVDSDRAARLRRVFAGIYAVDNDNSDTIIGEVIASPDDYVLKPCREGGGNNLWGAEMVDILKSLTKEKLSAYIVMKKIQCPTTLTVLVKNGAYTVAEASSELGIYSAMLSDGLHCKINDFCGHLLRTKAKGTNEGGVAAGYAMLDSPILV